MYAAICDDEKHICDELSLLLRQHNKKLQISVFYNGQDLCETIFLGKRFDFIFLDIEMNGMSGLEAAAKIREREMNTLLIFVSGHDRYFRQMIDVQPFAFLEKPLIRNDFTEVYKKIEAKLLNKARFFYEVNREPRSLPIEDIYYFQSDRRVLIAITKNEHITFYGKLSEVEQRLERYGFFSPHKSFLISFNGILHMDYDGVTMKDNVYIRIPESKRKTVKEVYYRLKMGV